MSPGTVNPPAPPPKDGAAPKSRKNIQQANWDASNLNHLRDYRKQLGVLDTSGPRIPSISRNPPTAASLTPTSYFPPTGGNGANMPPGTWFNDSSEELSHGFRRGSDAPEDSLGLGFPGTKDDRRPSVVSTVSSSGSKSSRGGYRKPLQNFFGEEYPGDMSRQNSATSLPTPFATPLDPQVPGRSNNRNRTNSFNNSTFGATFNSRPVSREGSRPRTPQPSSEVTPWEFEDRLPNDAIAVQELDRPPSEQRSAKSGKSHKLRLPGHRHIHSSKHDGKTAPAPRPEISSPFPLRPITSREDSMYSIRRDAALNSTIGGRTNTTTRATSPTPSSFSDLSKDPSGAQRSPNTHKAGAFLSRITGKVKRDRPTDLRDQNPSSVSSTVSLLKHAAKDPVPSPAKRSRFMDQSYKDKSMASSSKEKKEHRLGAFMSAKRQQPPKGGKKDPNDVSADHDTNNAEFMLDTDLTHMEGILHPGMTPPTGDFKSMGTFLPADDSISTTKEQLGFGWDAPDSWAVKRTDEDAMHEDYDDGSALAEEENDDKKLYCVRIFRVDSTFATLSLTLNSTVQQVIEQLGKKTLLQDDLSNYHIVMQKHKTSRQLEPHERPVVIQKKLLKQAGYQENDRLDEVGREDNSYLCRFTFIPARMIDYSNNNNHGLSRQTRFNNVNLQGKNLNTIPIVLYQKATEIISLDLSRNLSLDVPKDFIQACTNLREIKYTSNEATRLPPSIGLATRLANLDISNNRLQNLERAELQNLQSLQGLRMSNNRLTSLPSYFGQYRALRSLNLSSNSLSEFPDFLCNVSTLIDLDVSFNSISSIPNIGKLTCLERLWATNNKLSGSFTPSLQNLVNLREVDVRFNFIDNMDIMSQLPSLESLSIGHNSISAFKGSFHKLRILKLDHNPVTRFGITAPCPTLTRLDLASAKLAELPNDLFTNITGLQQLILDKNHFTTIDASIGALYRLETLSMARNSLSGLPPEIGRLSELRYLDVRENNIGILPPDIWHLRRLVTLNMSSNVLDGFPKPSLPVSNGDAPGYDGNLTPASTPGLVGNPSYEELGKLEDFQNRRPSQASSGYLSGSTATPPSNRKGSMASYNTANTSTTRKPSVASRATNDTALTPISRKDSSLTTRLTTTFAGSLKNLYLADNRLSDEVFDELALLPELRVLNLSHNMIIDIPTRTIRRWHSLTELYLSGNELTSLPTEDLGEFNSLKVLHINSNKFQVLPAELGKVTKLAVLDVASNSLKYNVSNWPYDWNWNWNKNLKYLNLSGNKRLEIKPSTTFSAADNAAMRGGKDLTEFTALQQLRILGLMDVTMMVPSVPEQTEDRRVRTSGSTVGPMAYGMADSLGRHDHVSTLDMVIPRFRSNDDEQILGLFDGQPLSTGGSRIAKYLYDTFKVRFAEELIRMRQHETPIDAMRRTYLSLNKEIATAANSKIDKSLQAPPIQHRNMMPDLMPEDLLSGSVATVLYIKGIELYVSNIGDAQALLIRSEGGHKILTQKHDPAESNERARIREAGGFVSRQGKLNDEIEVSRAFGYVDLSPSVIASPYIQHLTLGETDEMILIASRELWEYLTPDFAVDVARSERSDLMRAAQKLRDLAIAFGANNKIMVMLLGVSDIRTSKRRTARRPSVSMGPAGSPDDFFASRKPRNRRKDLVNDSKLARLDQEVPAPTGDVSLVFTDIKNSTLLWETYPIAMRSAIKMHNELMRRQLRIIGGYEVKTEGDAFMVAFPTVTSALLWCFTIQSQLLEVPWPQEILNSIHGQEVFDADGNVIFRGLSVRMGIHYGAPVCEVDPVTKRMDYFGPMVNRASRISSVADGGQITVSSDFINEVQRLLFTHEEAERSGSTGSEDAYGDTMMSQTIDQELRSLSSQGFEVKDLGERRLKGLENPEYIYLMYPHSLASRLTVQRQIEAGKMMPTSGGDDTIVKRGPGEGELTIDCQNVWDLWSVSLRLEMLCSSLEGEGTVELKPPETALLERMKTRSGEMTDRFLFNFVEHQVSRIEVCYCLSLALSHSLVHLVLA